MTDSITLTLAGGDYTPISNANPAVPAPDVDVPRVSNLSRARAAQGDPNLSAETQAAIANGALPPIVLSSSEEASAAVDTTRDSAVDVALSAVAQQSLANNSSTGSNSSNSSSGGSDSAPAPSSE